MKKIYILLAAFLLTGAVSKAQDTLLFEDFELNAFYTNLDSIDVLPGTIIDPLWYSCDADMIPNGAAQNRPDGWYAAYPVSDVDRYETVYGTVPAPDTNTVLAANSWNNNGDGASGMESNWLVTPNLKLGAHDTLFWKSAPSQTPRYLDGYEVLLSTTDNSDFSFTNVLFTAAEMIGTAVEDTIYSSFTFSPSTGTPVPFVHGADGTYIDFADLTATHLLHGGQLEPFMVALDAYANKNVFIAFHHNTHDDNYITLDDIMVRGTPSNPSASITENHNELGLSLFPNPATDNVQVNYTIAAETNVTINLYDVTGKLVSTVSNESQAQGRHFAHINTTDLAKGFYTVKVSTAFGQSTSKLIKN